ncbi:MAG TPA: haloacid dehalogenase type II [Nitrospirota bacterium]|nr:haloacid dehalogenase type II [Nitrospirota bacterium]
MAGIEDIQVLAFDAYGTIFDVFSVTALCEELFPGKGSALARLWRLKQLQYSLLRSLMGRHRDFWNLTEDGLVYASKSLHLDLTSPKRKQLMDAFLHLALFPDVMPGLTALKKKGLLLSILSNGDPKMLGAVVENGGISGLFDTIISAKEAGIYKPSPRVYMLGPERMKVGSDQLGFVSSNSWDISGAASAGLPTFWIQRSEIEPPEELGFSAHHTVKSVSELAQII